MTRLSHDTFSFVPQKNTDLNVFLKVKTLVNMLMLRSIMSRFDLKVELYIQTPY